MDAILAQSGANSFNIDNADSISTVHTCIKILAETISKLPIEVYQSDITKGKLKDKSDYRYQLLHYNPNGYTTSQIFFAAMEYHKNITGNAFARIYRQNGRVTALEIVQPSTVLGYKVVKNELYYELKKTDKKSELINANDMLHFKGAMTKNGIWGMNPIEALRTNLSSTYKGLKTIDKFYENNANTTKALRSTVSGANQKQMLEALGTFKKEYGGAANAGKILPLPPNTELQELSLNFADAQFIETVKFNANQIASLYGVPPHLVGNMEASKFNNVEQLQLNFKTTTISAIARMYRQELEFKLLTTKERDDGKSIEFNLMSMVETDHRTRIEAYRTLANIGVMSPADIQRLEGFAIYDGAESHYIQTNMMSVEKYNAKPTEIKE